MSGFRGAVVEIVDPRTTDGVLVPSVVRVNGVDVGLIAEGGVVVNPGSPTEVATVTLTLLPSEVRIFGEGHVAQETQ